MSNFAEEGDVPLLYVPFYTQHGSCVLIFDISFISFYISAWFIYLEYVKCQNLTPKKRECHGSLNLQKSRCRY
jgi:hypothetical protein